VKPSAFQVGEPPNKGMKLTKPEHNGASQLIPGVRRLVDERSACRPGVDTAHGESLDKAGCDAPIA